MANLTQYRETVQELLHSYAAFSRDDREIDTELILDNIRDHYQLVYSSIPQAVKS
jgi:XisI protein